MIGPDDETLVPCPAGEACKLCFGENEVRDNLVHWAPCEACAACTLCHGSQMVAVDVRAAWKKRNL